MRHRAGLGLAGLALSWTVLPAAAEVPLEGTFLASRACDALVSIRKDTNPGNIITGPGLRYRLIAGNRKKPTHYRIEIPTADPPERWVAANCGRVQSAATSQAAPAPETPSATAPELAPDVAPDLAPDVAPEPAPEPAPKAAPKVAPKPAPASLSYVLALSWQPAFCETNQKKPECRWQTGRGRDANYLSLHGLWPQPSSKAYCDQPAAVRAASQGGRWKDIPPIDLSLSTRAGLEEVMPGTRSLLERHEWAKHGSCYPADAEGYFADSVRLVEAVNASPVADLLMQSIGRRVTAADIRAAFDQGFGPGAGNRVRVVCKDDDNRRLISEVTLSLKGDIPAGTALSDLLLAAPPSDPGCPAGVLDPVGPQ